MSSPSSTDTAYPNTDALFSLLGLEARRRIFQALCTERDRLEALGESEALTLTHDLVEIYASNLVADECCGRLIATHAYCNTPAR